MITGELCTLCDGDGFMPNYIGSCPRCGGGGKEPMTVEVVEPRKVIYNPDGVVPIVMISEKEFRAQYQSGKESMTTVTTQAGELNTFSSTELDAIESALSIAAQHYSTFAETLRREPNTRQAEEFREIFEKQAEEARVLVLRIQANR